MKPLTRLPFVTLALTTAIGLASATGCANSADGEVATLGTGATDVEDQSTQRQSAEAFYSCLLDAGLPVKLSEYEGGDASVDWEDGFDVLLGIPGEGGSALPGKSGEFDHGGDDPNLTTWNTHAQNEDYFLMVDATNPEAVIPFDTSADLLRAVIDACPDFNEEQAKRVAQPDFDEKSFVQDPSIAIEVPQEMADGEGSSEDENARLSPTVTHYNELTDILYDKARAFWNAQDDSGEGIATAGPQ
ncbi:MAG: hypothetical protein LBJ08_03550 [Bifidobacteriaceae bacterium]|jgi:hypothetical protein|nr:hypothetical protein [Bifidobacteriaceae bacterium]